MLVKVGVDQMNNKPEEKDIRRDISELDIEGQDHQQQTIKYEQGEQSKVGKKSVSSFLFTLFLVVMIVIVLAVGLSVSRANDTQSSKYENTTDTNINTPEPSTKSIDVTSTTPPSQTMAGTPTEQPTLREPQNDVACPIEMPEVFSSCSLEDLSCYWGEECCFIEDDDGNCNKECSAQTSCSCRDDGTGEFVWVCLFLDFCFRPPEMMCNP